LGGLPRPRPVKSHRLLVQHSRFFPTLDMSAEKSRHLIGSALFLLLWRALANCSPHTTAIWSACSAASAARARPVLFCDTTLIIHSIADLQQMAVAEWLQSFNSVRGPMKRTGIMRVSYTVSPCSSRLVKTASSGSFGFQGPGSHLIGLVQQFRLSIGGCGGWQWGWKRTHLLLPRPQFFLRKWMWANQRMTPTEQARCPGVDSQ